MVFLPGLSGEGNLRPGVKLMGQKTQYSKPMPMMTTSVSRDSLMDRETSARQQVIYEVVESKSASLKDLCPEDKRRIANLIKELARVSEEKEVTEERLKAEQESFEKKIRQLEEQNDLIITEREALQQQYRECQELLSLYQRYLSEQQEKLKLSEPAVNTLSPRRQVSHEKSPQEPKSLEHNGCYLGLPRPEALYKDSRILFPESGVSVLTAHPHCKNDPIARMAHKSGHHEDLNNIQVENGFIRKSNNMVPSMHIEAHSPRIAYDINPPTDEYRNTLPSHCYMYREQQRTAERIPNRYQVDPLPQKFCAPFPEPDEFVRPPDISFLNDKVKSKPQEMSPVKELTEERKHKLLLQKMELEIEKDRLQQLLAQQEAKLLRKQQQLSQSWQDSNRGQAAVDSEELIVDEALMKQAGMTPLMNGISSGQRTPISSKIFKNQLGSNSTGRKIACFSAGSEEEALWVHKKKETVTTEKGSRKDAATSPVMRGNRKELATTATSPIQANSLRYESSLLELVEERSPVSAAKPLSHCRNPYDWNNKNHAPPIGSHHKPMNQPTASVSRRSEPEDELEENQILGEIFFIC
ncbi:protein hinderin [Microcaecilia unicolor]|uniref:Protein hinderin-like n=1 Tax=Microcaecilia unicolor TaxID=1415580 RepID=A0A6P7X603_9AMPH|nr:protein hinderin-like [Microcaecilia unicolor]